MRIDGSFPVKSGHISIGWAKWNANLVTDVTSTLAGDVADVSIEHVSDVSAEPFVEPCYAHDELGHFGAPLGVLQDADVIYSPLSQDEFRNRISTLKPMELVKPAFPFFSILTS